MSKTLEVYLSFSSPFAYLAHSQLRGLAERTQCKIEYRVIDMYKVLQLAGNPGPLQVPAKAKYIVKDVFDWCKHYGISLKIPSRIPIPSTPSAAACVAAERGGKLPEFVDRLMRACWMEDEDIADALVLGKLAAEIGLDAGVIAAAVSDAEILKQLEVEAEAAVERGVFGIPMFFIGDDMYWGNDRLILVEEAIAR